MSGLKHRYLIFEAPRTQLADALVEYRAFARSHPDDPLAEDLLDVARKVRLALQEERRIRRAAGTPGKVNAHCKLSAALTVRHDGSWRQWSCKP